MAKIYPRGFGGSGGGGGGSGQRIRLDVFASAFAPRVAGSNEGVVFRVEPPLAGPVEGNDWKLQSGPRLQDQSTYATVAISTGDLNATYNGLPFTWEGVVVDTPLAVPSGEAHLYYATGQEVLIVVYNAGGTFSSTTVISTTALLESIFATGAEFVHVGTALLQAGRFANDAAALAYIIANKQNFRDRATNDVITLAYFNTTIGSIQIGELTIGTDAQPDVEIRYDTSARLITLEYLTTDTVQDIVDQVNTYNAHGIYAELADGTPVDAIFSRSNGLGDWEIQFANGFKFDARTSGFALGPEQNTFIETTESEAEDARDAYETANAAWKAAYQGNQSLFIVLRWGSTGDQKAQVLSSDGTTWTDISLAFIGPRGRDGDASAALAAQRAAETARDEAVTAKNEAESAETDAETAEANAQAAETAAEAAQIAAETAQTNAETAKADAEFSDLSAFAHSNSAAQDSNRAGTARFQAVDAKLAAEAARDEAVTARNQARSARDAALAAQAAAEAARDAAQNIGGHLAAIQGYIAAGTQTGATVELTDAGELNINVTGGGGGSGMAVTDDLYLGTSDDEIPGPDELNVPGVNGMGVIEDYVGHKHHLIARLASEGDITGVFYSDDPSMDNAIGAFTKYADTVIPTGETEEFNVWVSNQALTNTADVTLMIVHSG